MKSEVNVTGKRLQITRLFDAPRPDVFACWSQAEKLQQWSGCKETTRCGVVMDFRVGGSFTRKMQIAVNGGSSDFSLTGIYEEITSGTDRLRCRPRPWNHAGCGGVLRGRRQDQGRNDIRMDLPTAMCQIVSQGTLESLDKLDLLVTRQAAVNRI